jgi:hypothetical protein
MSYAYDYLALRASFVYKFTGKDRDAESGLDNLGRATTLPVSDVL